ncbi:kelch domain-containing protein 7B-like [Delphinus delphis]|uniref:kelch domain-containing protein 7B-like n=1 Tax=Delphinus delphis TaxID=9728 RepID=UPI0037530C71
MRARAASAPLAGWAAGRAAGCGAPGGGGAPPAGQAPPRAQRPQSPGAAAPSRAARRLRVRRRRGGRERGPAQSPPPQALVAGLPRGSGRGAGGPPPTHPSPSWLTFLWLRTSRAETTLSTPGPGSDTVR